MMVMEVIQRNFFRLLRGGAFGCTGEAIEPMSPWKWNTLYNISLVHGVATLVYDGIKLYGDDFFMQIPPGLKAKWEKTKDQTVKAYTEGLDGLARLFDAMNHEQMRPILMHGQSLAALYDEPSHRTNGDVDIFLPYAPQAKKAEAWAKANGQQACKTERGTLQYSYNGLEVEHYTQAIRLTNFFLNKKLQGIINREVRCCDSTYIYIGDSKIETLPPTLGLLLTMLRIAHYTIIEGIRLRLLVDLGMTLRKVGNIIDFVKLQKWIDQLHFRRMAQLEGAMLVEFFKFEEDEIPFMDAKGSKDTKKVNDDIFSFKAGHSDDWYFTQGKNIFVRTSDSGAMTWQLKHVARFFGYYPAESITALSSSFAHSLSHIEE